MVKGILFAIALFVVGDLCLDGGDLVRLVLGTVVNFCLTVGDTLQNSILSR